VIEYKFDKALEKLMNYTSSESIELQKKVAEEAERVYLKSITDEYGIPIESLKTLANAGGDKVAYTGKFSKHSK